MIAEKKQTQQTSSFTGFAGTAWGYIRVSTDKQDNSLEVQRDAIKRYCAFRGYPEPRIVVDEDVSGSKPLNSRPNGGRMVDALEDGDIVVVAKLDRAFRDAIDGMITLRNWWEAGVDLHMVNMGQIADTSTSDGFFTIGILLLQAEAERRKISERTKEGLGRMQEKCILTGNAPYGFRGRGTRVKADGKVCKNTYLEPDPVEQEVVNIVRVHLAKAQAGEKVGKQKIAMELERKGYTTRGGHKIWPTTTVTAIIDNIKSGKHDQMMKRWREKMIEKGRITEEEQAPPA